MGGVHPQRPQGVYRPLSDCVAGQPGHKGCAHAVVCQRYRHIGFAAAKRGLKLVILKKAVVSVWRQAQHYFSEGNDFFHIKSSFPKSLYFRIR